MILYKNIVVYRAKWIYFYKTKKEKENALTNSIKAITNKGNTSLNLTEADLIRDLLFVFQGINGHALSYNERDDCFQLRPSIPVPEPSRKIVNSLCELGWLFKKITDFLEKPCHGLIRQSLNIAVREELNEYYRLLAVLENIRAKQSEDEGGR